MWDLLVKAGENVSCTSVLFTTAEFQNPLRRPPGGMAKDVRQVHSVSTQPQRRVKRCRLQDMIQMHHITLGNSQRIKKMLF